MIRLRKAEWVEVRLPHLPGTGDNAKWYKWGDTTVCVAKEVGLWHISVSCPHRYPTWDEIFTAWYDLVPGAGSEFNGAIVLPRKSHPNCFHVHQLRDAEMPEGIVL